MTPATTSGRTSLANAWTATHERVVGKDRPAPPGNTPATEPQRPKAPQPKKHAAPSAATNFKFLNVRVPSEIHKTIRILSVEDDKSLQTIVTEALTAYATSRKDT